MRWALILIVVVVPTLGGCPEPNVPAPQDGNSGDPNTPTPDGSDSERPTDARGLIRGLYDGSIAIERTITRSGGYAVGDPSRLEVTQTLRDACDGFLLSDAEIRSLIIAAEHDRTWGFSRAQQLQATADTCEESEFIDVRIACRTCGFALVDQVFSIEGTAPEVVEETDDLSLSLVVNDEGLPDASSIISQVGSIQFRTTLIDDEVQPDIVVVNYTIEADSVETTTGEVRVTLFGQGIDRYKQISETQIEFSTSMSLGVSDLVGTFTIVVEGRGTLER